MMLVLTLLTLFTTSSTSTTSPSPDVNTSLVGILDMSYRLQEEAAAMREEAEDMREEALAMRAEGYESMKQAFNILVEAFSLMKIQYADNVRGIRTSLNSMVDRMGQLEDAIGGVDEKLEEAKQDSKEKSGIISNSLSSIAAGLERLEAVSSDSELKLQEIQTVSSNLTHLPARLHQIETAIGFLDQKMDISNEKATSFELKLDNIQNISTNLTSMPAQLDRLGTVLEELDGKFDNVEETTTSIKAQVATTLGVTTAVKVRQQAWLSEVRLISLYKMTHESNRQSSYDTGVITDGQFLFSRQTDGNMRAYSYTASTAANNKVYIMLGGLFRVHKVQVWNRRDSNVSNFAGTKLYVDDTLIGTAAGSSSYFFYFPVPDESPVYGSTVTLHQPLSRYLHILEVQVWGCGPFNETDIFT